MKFKSKREKFDRPGDQLNRKVELVALGSPQAVFWNGREFSVKDIFAHFSFPKKVVAVMDTRNYQMQANYSRSCHEN